MPRSTNSTDISSEFKDSVAGSMTDAPEMSPAPSGSMMPSVSAGKSRVKMKNGRMKRQHTIVLVLLVIAVLGVAGTVYFYDQYQTLEKNPNAVQEAQVAALVKQVGQLMLLPNETPTVATVEDVTSLKGQPFFTNAANGDKVLVFVNARQAILYRPSENKIINVAPLYFQNSQATAQEQAAVSSGTSASSNTSSVADTSNSASSKKSASDSSSANSSDSGSSTSP